MWRRRLLCTPGPSRASKSTMAVFAGSDRTDEDRGSETELAMTVISGRGAFDDGQRADSRRGSRPMRQRCGRVEAAHSSTQVRQPAHGRRGRQPCRAALGGTVRAALRRRRVTDVAGRVGVCGATTAMPNPARDPRPSSGSSKPTLAWPPLTVDVTVNLLVAHRHTCCEASRLRSSVAFDTEPGGVLSLTPSPWAVSRKVERPWAMQDMGGCAPYGMASTWAVWRRPRCSLRCGRSGRR